MYDKNLFVLNLEQNYTIDFFKLMYGCKWNISPRCLLQVLFDNTVFDTTICHSYINLPDTEIPIWRIDFELLLGQVQLKIYKYIKDSSTENPSMTTTSLFDFSTQSFKSIMDTLYSCVNELLYNYENSYCKTLLKRYIHHVNKYLGNSMYTDESIISSILISYRNFQSLCDNNLSWDGAFEIPITLFNIKDNKFTYILNYNYIQLIDEYSDGNNPDEFYLIRLTLNKNRGEHPILTIPLLLADDVLDSLDTFILCLIYPITMEESDIKSRFHYNVDNPIHYNMLQDEYLSTIKKLMNMVPKKL